MECRIGTISECIGDSFNSVGYMIPLLQCFLKILFKKLTRYSHLCVVILHLPENYEFCDNFFAVFLCIANDEIIQNITSR